MSKEIHLSQRIAIWNKVLEGLLDEQLHFNYSLGICKYLARAIMNEGISDNFVQASINLPRLFPEFDKYRPTYKQWFEMWWKRDEHTKRINVVKEIINQLEEEQLLYPNKTE